MRTWITLFMDVTLATVPHSLKNDSQDFKNRSLGQRDKEKSGTGIFEISVEDLEVAINKGNSCPERRLWIIFIVSGYI